MFKKGSQNYFTEKYYQMMIDEMEHKLQEKRKEYEEFEKNLAYKYQMQSEIGYLRNLVEKITTKKSSAD